MLESKAAWRTRTTSEAGATIIELLVASFIALVFVVAAGTAYLVNQKSYRDNDEKRQLQQTASQVMEIMEKKIRSGARAVIANPQRIQIFDKDGNEISRFRLATSGSKTKLFEQSVLLAQQDLIQLTFVPNSDTSSVVVSLVLEDSKLNKVGLRAAATLRNHPNLRNVSTN